MAASVAIGRSNLLRAIYRASKFSSSGTRSFSVPLRPSNSVPRRTPIPPHPLSPRLFRRQLSSLQPVHSAVASACLVSKLPSEVSTSSEELGSCILSRWSASALKTIFLKKQII